VHGPVGEPEVSGEVAGEIEDSGADDKRSAHSRWWSKLWCGSVMDVRALAAARAPAVKKVAPVSRA
jgi:hypothetical protein